MRFAHALNSSVGDQLGPVLEPMIIEGRSAARGHAQDHATARNLARVLGRFEQLRRCWRHPEKFSHHKTTGAIREKSVFAGNLKRANAGAGFPGQSQSRQRGIARIHSIHPSYALGGVRNVADNLHVKNIARRCVFTHQRGHKRVADVHNLKTLVVVGHVGVSFPHLNIYRLSRSINPTQANDAQRITYIE